MAEVLPPRHYIADSPDSDDNIFGSTASPLASRLGRFTLHSDNTESDEYTSDYCNTAASPLITHASETDDEVARPYDTSRTLDLQALRRDRVLRPTTRQGAQLVVTTDQENAELSMLALMIAAFRRSLLTCNAAPEDGMDIGWPTNVQHVAHVTFDRFNGFLGLPVEFEVEIPRRAPSASASVFGVSAESMQCSYDLNGNSVPTILLLMQEQLYNQGGLKAEGIFRINAENSHEEHVRDQLNKGLVPYDIDMHCLAGLIKAWFRELPRGVLDSLTPEQLLQCNTEEHCVDLVKQLPPTQGALLDWAINLMADVVQEEVVNKMNARNIAMVFAPNMTQMADPLTALMHAVQVMNFLKTLILRTLRYRQEAALDPKPTSSCPEEPHEDSHDSDYGGALLNGYTARDSSLREPKVDYEEYNHRKSQPKQRSKAKNRGGRLVSIDQQTERVEAWELACKGKWGVVNEGEVGLHTSRNLRCRDHFTFATCLVALGVTGEGQAGSVSNWSSDQV